MDDDYMHSENTVIYIAENIPGTVENSVEYENLVTNFNSQLTSHCECELICSIDNCNCLKISGGTNYILNNINETNYLQYCFQKNISENLSKPLIECNSLCKCSSDCGNRLVQKGPTKNLVVNTCNGKGVGLFTNQFIPQGTFICEYAGEVITQFQAETRHHNNLVNGKMNYIFCLNEFSNNKQTQLIVDPTYFGNFGRYINHSCEPNCFIIPVRVESPLPKLAIFSQVDVYPHSEITFHYGANGFYRQDIQSRKKCLCGSKTCRGFLPNEKY